jgi:predicted 3-demethylubiquinone-9 3-methyltransferase (glyoxalase superfamily)
MQKVVPFIWFEDQAKKAADWYVSIFPNSKIIGEVVLPNTPSGDTLVVYLELNKSEFQFMNGGKMYERNPSISYMVACKTKSEVDEIWYKLSIDSEIIMPLDSYPFSGRFGWLNDRFGVSWQILLDEGEDKIQEITPCLLFVGKVLSKAEEAMNMYCSVIKDSYLIPNHLYRYGKDEAPEIEGTIMYSRFKLSNSEFVIGDSAQPHEFQFNEMQSLVIRCTDQAEMDKVWEQLSYFPESEQCGWIKDKFGISWQIVTYGMEEMMLNATREQLDRVVEAFLPMKKLDIKKIQNAYEGNC